jgi:hypothetical protein
VVGSLLGLIRGTDPEANAKGERNRRPEAAKVTAKGPQEREGDAGLVVVANLRFW